MIDKEQAEKIAEEAATSISEVFMSAMAVRGERFANAVGGIFNMHSITNGIAHLAAMSSDKAAAADISDKLLSIIAHTSGILLYALDTDELREEALNMAISLAKRGDEAQRRING